MADTRFRRKALGVIVGRCCRQSSLVPRATGLAPNRMVKPWMDKNSMLMLLESQNDNVLCHSSILEHTKSRWVSKEYSGARLAHNNLRKIRVTADYFLDKVSNCTNFITLQELNPWNEVIDITHLDMIISLTVSRKVGIFNLTIGEVFASQLKHWWVFRDFYKERLEIGGLKRFLSSRHPPFSAWKRTVLMWGSATDYWWLPISGSVLP